MHDNRRWKRTALLVALVVSMMFAGGLHAGVPLSNEQRLAFQKTSPGFIDAVVSTRPLAFYRLDTANGKSQTGHTQYNAIGGVSIARPGALNVANNLFAALNGKDGYLVTTQSGGITGSATLMAWVNLAALPSEARHAFYVMGQSQEGHDLDLRFEGDDTLAFHTAGESPLAYTPGKDAFAHHWHLIIATVDTRTGRRTIWWDGENVASDTKGGAPNPTAGALTIGESSAHAGRFFAGGIQEVAIWDRALTENEVMKIAGANRPAFH